MKPSEHLNGHIAQPLRRGNIWSRILIKTNDDFFCLLFSFITFISSLYHSPKSLSHMKLNQTDCGGGGGARETWNISLMAACAFISHSSSSLMFFFFFFFFFFILEGNIF